MAQNQIFRGTARRIETDGNGGDMKFFYHRTAIVIVQKLPAQISLNSGGYRTATTKLAMNQASNQFSLGFQVWQQKGDWFVTMRNGDVHPFVDGMTFTTKE